MTEELKKALESDDWQMQLILLHKKDSVKYPMNVETAKSTCKEMLRDCDTGMCLGVGWHGGKTPKEWEKESMYLKSVLKELETI